MHQVAFSLMSVVVLDGRLMRRLADWRGLKETERIEKDEEPRQPHSLTPSYLSIYTSSQAPSRPFVPSKYRKVKSADIYYGI